MKDTREFQTIRVEVEDALGRLPLNRADRLSAVGATMLQEMAESARWFDSHSELRVVVVSGAGRAFCAGADLKDSPAAAAARLDNSWLYRREVGQYGLRAADALETDARYNHRAGSRICCRRRRGPDGVCDLRVAADDAVFFIPEIELGIP